MKILIACEYSGVLRDAFAAVGHDAWSCDLLPTESPGQHIQGDAIQALKRGWDMMIGHPPCTYIAVSGIHWNKRILGRSEKTEEALEFFGKLLNSCSTPKICIENPISIAATYFRPSDQIVQPYEYGDDASKQTCLWLKGLPKLVPDPDMFVAPREVRGKAPWGIPGKSYSRWANQTDSGQNKLGPSPTRWKERAKTYKGIADAMVAQWG